MSMSDKISCAESFDCEAAVFDALDERFQQLGQRIEVPLSTEMRLFDGANSLEIDSLLALEFLTDLERRLNIDLIDRIDFERVHTLGDVIAVVRDTLRQHPTPTQVAPSGS